MPASPPPISPSQVLLLHYIYTCLYSEYHFLYVHKIFMYIYIMLLSTFITRHSAFSTIYIFRCISSCINAIFHSIYKYMLLFCKYRYYFFLWSLLSTHTYSSEVLTVRGSISELKMVLNEVLKANFFPIILFSTHTH